ncbi:MAG TPA: TetR/AcrR family transcriptional regulator [Spirillospora sp.]|nr:TetR/AcrR family transcriptional regulator [Spirillospora sp.]
MARKPADQTVSRKAILMAAADVLRRHGYDATTMKDIAAAVNLTAASLYHHFPNKDALLLAVLEAGLEHAIAQLEPIARSDQPAADRLRAMIRVHVVSLTSHTAVGAAMIFESRSLLALKPGSGSDDLLARRDAFFARRDHFENLFRQVIQAGVDRGEFQPVDVPIFVKTMLGAHNWVAVWYREGGRLTGAQIADQMADIFLRALCQPTGS